MNEKKRILILLVAVALLCGGVMAFVDGFLKPGYAIKSGIKAALFLLVPLVASRLCGEIKFLQLLRPKKKGILPSILLGMGIYVRS